MTGIDRFTLAIAQLEPGSALILGKIVELVVPRTGHAPSSCGYGISSGLCAENDACGGLQSVPP